MQHPKQFRCEQQRPRSSLPFSLSFSPLGGGRRLLLPVLQEAATSPPRQPPQQQPPRSLSSSSWAVPSPSSHGRRHRRATSGAPRTTSLSSLLVWRLSPAKEKTRRFQGRLRLRRRRPRRRLRLWRQGRKVTLPPLGLQQQQQQQQNLEDT
jgi:hypothetical protein